MQKINVLTLSIDKLLAEARDGDVKEVKKSRQGFMEKNNFFSAVLGSIGQHSSQFGI